MCKYLWLKERKRQSNLEMLVDPDLHQSHEVITTDGKIALLKKHLNNLSPACKEILKLYALGYNEQKICKVLNLGNREAVKNKKYYCKIKLQDMMMNDPLFNELYG